MDPNQTVELLKNLLERQENLYQLLIMVLIGITTLLVGSTWLWNFFIAKKQIKVEVEKKFKAHELTFGENMKVIKTEYETKINETIDTKYSKIYVDISRLFAIITKDKQLFGASFLWWIECLKSSLESKNEKFIKWSLNGIDETLNQKELTTISKELFNIESFLKLIEQVPDLLCDEKARIIKKAKILKVE